MTWKHTIYPLGQQHLQLGNMVAGITLHCTFGNHAGKLGQIIITPVGVVKNYEKYDFICHCPVLGYLRARFLGQCAFGSLSELSNMELGSNDTYIRKS